MTIIENGPFRLNTIARLVNTTSSEFNTEQLPVRDGLAVEYNVNYYNSDESDPSYLVLVYLKWEDGVVIREYIDSRDLDFVKSDDYDLFSSFVRTAHAIVRTANINVDEGETEGD